MMKDDISLNGKTGYIHLVCDLCKEKGHLENQCHLIHLKVSMQEVIKKTVTSEQVRNYKPTRPRKKERKEKALQL